MAKKIPELLVPANNLHTFKYAIAYGADAVYIGGKDFNLRSLGQNFLTHQIQEAVTYAHERGCKVYLTVNAVIFESELKKFSDYLQEIKDIDIDAYIITDAGLIDEIIEVNPAAKIHISTQANVTNHMGVDFYARAGASRVNIAREVKIEDLEDIIARSNAEIEVFTHGALCISYSGRCFLSKYMSGRDANKGQCAHTCRWKYYLMEETRPNLFYHITQDQKGTYLFNSRDLCLLEKVQDLAEAGVASIKIEGRMKTEYYVSLVTWAYRQALDAVRDDNFTEEKKRFLMQEVQKTTHRNFTTGFMFLDDYRELEQNDVVHYIKDYRFVGVLEDGIVRVKNQFHTGQTLEIIQPKEMPYEVPVKKIQILKNGDFIPSNVANPNDLAIINSIKEIHPYAVLRVSAD